MKEVEHFDWGNEDLFQHEIDAKATWQSIEQKLEQRKKKRRFIFWFVLPGSLLLLTFLGYIATRHSATTDEALAASSVSTKNLQNSLTLQLQEKTNSDLNVNNNSKPAFGNTTESVEKTITKNNIRLHSLSPTTQRHANNTIVDRNLINIDSHSTERQIASLPELIKGHDVDNRQHITEEVASSYSKEMSNLDDLTSVAMDEVLQQNRNEQLKKESTNELLDPITRLKFLIVYNTEYELSHAVKIELNKKQTGLRPDVIQFSAAYGMMQYKQINRKDETKQWAEQRHSQEQAFDAMSYSLKLLHRLPRHFEFSYGVKANVEHTRVNEKGSASETVVKKGEVVEVYKTGDVIDNEVRADVDKTITHNYNNNYFNAYQSYEILIGLNKNMNMGWIGNWQVGAGISLMSYNQSSALVQDKDHLYSHLSLNPFTKEFRFVNAVSLHLAYPVGLTKRMDLIPFFEYNQDLSDRFRQFDIGQLNRSYLVGIGIRYNRRK